VLAQLLEPPCTDPYARWCGRGGAARLPPIPIIGPSLHLPQCSIIPALGVIAAMEGGATSFQPTIFQPPVLDRSPRPINRGEPGCARVDAALAPDERIEGLTIRLVRRSVSHDPRPLAPRPFVSLGRVASSLLSWPLSYARVINAALDSDPVAAAVEWLADFRGTIGGWAMMVILGETASRVDMCRPA
jgi:hypothetical protein